MEQLIADANEYAKANGQAADLSIDSFSDIVTAIELIQEKQGIAGTTAKEASTTIEGAFNSTKSAWENLVAGFANPDADVGKLMDNLIISIVGDGNGTGLLAQLIPAVERALQGIGQFLTQAAPIISAYLPGLMQKILPPLISAATTLVAGLVRALPMIIQTLIQQAPMIISKLAQAFKDTAPLLIQLGKNLMKSIYDGLTQAFPQITPVIEGFKKIFETAFEKIGKVVDFFKKHFETIKGIVVAVGGAIAAVGLVGIIGGIAGAIGTVVGAIGGLISALSMIKSFAGLVSVITTLAGGPLVLIPALIGAIVAAVIYLWNTSETFRNFVLGLWAKIQEIVAGAMQVLSNLAAAFVAIGQDIINTISNAWKIITTTVKKAIETVQKIITSVFNAIRSTVSSIWNSIRSTISSVWSSIRSAVSNAVSAVRSAVSNAFSAVRNTVSNIMSAVWTTISNVWNSASTTVANVVNTIKNKVSSGFTAVKEKVSSIFGDIKDKIKEKMDDAKELVKKAVDKIKSVFPLKLGKIFSGVKLPHFKISGGKIPWGIGGAGEKPSVSIEWYKKAYQNPYLFTEPTVLSGIGFGDGAGAEMVYGHENLMKDIRNAVYDVMREGQNFTQNITINSPKQLNPSEVARQTRNSTRTMLMRMRTT